MSAIQEIFSRFAPAYVARFGALMPNSHRQVINAIINCRTGALGAVCFACGQCGCRHVTAASCGNRHCPTCQGAKAFAWLDRQIERQLPGPHFMLTFTVPEALRGVLRANQKVGYGALFAASAEAIKALAKDTRHLGASGCGFFGVLHTWGRQLQYHPHIHYVIPGGAIDVDSGRWHRSKNAFFLPVRALSKLFRGKFLALMKASDLYALIPESVWLQDWNVNCQSVPSADATLNYLAPYVFKVAISDHRISKVEGDQVHVRWKKVGSQRNRLMILDAVEFMRRFLTHVLPSGFMKIRYFGFLGSSAKITLEQVHLSIQLASRFELKPPTTTRKTTPVPACRDCGGTLQFVCVIRPCNSTDMRRTGPPRAPSLE